MLCRVAALLISVASSACVTTGVVSVRVVDENKRPVAGATVSVAGRHAMSNDQGVADVTGVASGEYWIYVPDSRGLKSCPSRVNVQAGEKALATVLMRSGVHDTQLVHGDLTVNGNSWSNLQTLSYGACPGLPSSGTTEMLSVEPAQ